MITRMTKYSFIVLSQELDSFLSQVQQLGMVDITRSDRAIDETSRTVQHHPPLPRCGPQNPGSS